MKIKKPIIGISIGDPNGIGIEVILKTFADSRMMDFCTPIVYASSKLISSYSKKIKFSEIEFYNIKDESKLSNNKRNILNCINEDFDVKFGLATKYAGKIAFLSLQRATEALKNKKIDALVTAPINKLNIKENKKDFIGHTEFLENNFDGKSLMIMTSEIMKVAFVTGHIPLSKVASNINSEIVLNKIIHLNSALEQDFALQRPKIAILGLNPHAGENGMLGFEEEKFINPAIESAKSKNILAYGAFSADSFFTTDNLNKFDAVLCMYHDQGLIPFKSFSFNQGVNYTAGLEIIRTSPVHGTAYEIAGELQADPCSFRQAVFSACKIYKARHLIKQM